MTMLIHFVAVSPLRRVHAADRGRRHRLQNKAAVYGLLLQTASETMTTIAADPRHPGARIGFTAVLHRWSSALTHYPPST